MHALPASVKEEWFLDIGVVSVAELDQQTGPRRLKAILHADKRACLKPT
jgi:hypothetical protein